MAQGNYYPGQDLIEWHNVGSTTEGDNDNVYPLSVPTGEGYQIIKLGIQAPPGQIFALYDQNGAKIGDFRVGASGIFELDAGIWLSPQIQFPSKEVIVNIENDEEEKLDSGTLSALISSLQRNIDILLEGKEDEVLGDWNYDGTTDEDYSGQPSNNDMWTNIYSTIDAFQDKFSNEYLKYKRKLFGQYVPESIEPHNIIIDYLYGVPESAAEGEE